MGAVFRRAIFLFAHKPGAWSAKWDTHMDETAQNDPDRFVAERAVEYLRDILRSKQAYECHDGRKAFARYEDLTTDPLGNLARNHSALGLEAREKQLERAVERHAWEKVPEERKGEGRIFRKATPGGWREDLTPEQARIVEEAARPVFEEFYA